MTAERSQKLDPNAHLGARENEDRVMRALERYRKAVADSCDCKEPWGCTHDERICQSEAIAKTQLRPAKVARLSRFHK